MVNGTKIAAAAVFLIFTIGGSDFLNAQDLYLNEIMSSNATTITDEDGDAEDWIEIYYAGEQPRNLGGYGLSDDYDNPFRWSFPDVTIQPGEFLLIWASNKDRASSGSPLHTNFAISASGEEVILTHPDGTRIDELPPTEIPTDISIGRQPDGTGDWVFFEDPTPGESNTTESFTETLAPPLFSLDAGFQPTSFTLELGHGSNNVEIRYTLDGSEPTENSNLYEDGIEILYTENNYLMFIQTTPDEGAQRGYGWRTPASGIPGATIVRAKAFRTGAIPSDIVSRTYVNGGQYHDLPVISISTNQENLFSDSIGIYVPGDIYHDLGWAHEDHWGRPNANYHQRGIEWERPATMEVIEPDGSYHHQNIGLRIHGGGSRAQPQKSFRLYARNSYGDSRFNYDLFQDGETGYNRLILRNSGQDFFTRTMMFADALAHTLVSRHTFDTMKARPFVVYVNGEYWGIKNLRERYDRHYLERNYGVEAGEIDYLTNLGEVYEGSAHYYNTVLDSLENHHINNLGGLEFVERHFDLQNFAEFYASQIYYSNIDWPGNNNDYWRYTGPPEPKGSARDGRFRWMMYDLDFGFAHFNDTDYEGDLFAHLLSPQGTNWANPPRSTLLFRSFIINRDFLEYYVNTQLDLLNTTLREERVAGMVNDFRSVYETEIGRHIQRWQYPEFVSQWENNVNLRVRFAENRPERLRQQMMSRFQVGRLASVNIHHANPDRGVVKLNDIIIREDEPGIGISPYPWSGTYFTGVPVTLTALPEPGYILESWEINGEIYRTQKVTILPSVSTNVTVQFTEITDPGDSGKDLMYYWYFHEDLSNNTPLETLYAGYTSTGKDAILTYQPAISPYPPADGEDTAGIMDRVNDPTELNYQPAGNQNRSYNEEDMRGIRVRNPSKVVRDGREYESAMVFSLPTTEFEDVVISFAANRTSNGQEQMVFHYSVNEGNPEWKQDDLTVTSVNTSEEYSIYVVDFTDIELHRHNPDFRFRITFDGENTVGDSGNTRYNNIAVFGSPYTGPRIEDITETRMEPNYPNPFSTVTTIDYQVDRDTDVVIDLFDITGRRVQRLVNTQHERGFYSIDFDSAGLASGVYLLRLQAGVGVDVQKMMLIRR